eukprot:gene999-380_t
MRTEGESMTHSLNGVLLQRVWDVLPDPFTLKGAGGTEAVLDTLKMPHVLWRKNEAAWREELDELAGNTIEQRTNECVALKHRNWLDEQKCPPAKRQLRWMLGSPLYTSEREPYVFGERGRAYSLMAQRVLQPKGWGVLDAYDVSAALMFDATGQDDGLHWIGPVPKVLWLMWINDICSGVSHPQLARKHKVRTTGLVAEARTT